MNNKKITLYIDLGFCLIFLPLLTVLVPVERLLQDHTIFLFTLGGYLFCLYYANRRFNIPALLLNKKYTKGVGLLLIMIAVTYLLTLFPFPDSIQQLTVKQIKFRDALRTQMIWFLFLVVIGFCFSLGLLSEVFRQRMLQQQVEAEKNKAELALYKAQINPHFLFNTLNTLYGLALAQSEKMELAFVKFSDILKYMYANANRDTISITEEVEYIEQYIDLQTLRLNEQTKIYFTHQIDNPEIQVPPMLLITFIENAFKYGISSSKQSDIHIFIGLTNGILCFRSENRILSKVHKTNDSVGIANCRNRLNLLYPDRYDLNISSSEDLFKVVLTINTKKQP